MNTLCTKNDQVNIAKYSYRWREVPNTKGPLLVPDGQLTYEIKEHRDLALHLILVNLLEHILGPVGVSSELITEVRPLLAGQNPPECELRRHNDSVQTLAIDQPREVPHLLHPIGARPL